MKWIIRMLAIAAMMAGIAWGAEPTVPQNTKEYYLCRKHFGVSATFPDSLTSLATTPNVKIKLPATLARNTSLTSTANLSAITLDAITWRLEYKVRADSGMHTALMLAAQPWDSTKQMVIPIERFAAYACSTSGGWWAAQLTTPRADFRTYARVIVDNWGSGTVDSVRVTMGTVSAPLSVAAPVHRQKVIYRVKIFRDATVAPGAVRLDSVAIANTRYAWSPKPDYYVLRLSGAMFTIPSGDSSVWMTAKFQDLSRTILYQIGTDSLKMKLDFQGTNKIAGEVETVSYCGNVSRSRLVNNRGKTLTRASYEVWAIKEE